MTEEKKKRLLVDYMVEVVRVYDLPDKAFSSAMQLIQHRLFGVLTDSECVEFAEWVEENVPLQAYNECLQCIENMGFDVELGLVSNETIYQRLRKAGLI